MPIHTLVYVLSFVAVKERTMEKKALGIGLKCKGSDGVSMVTIFGFPFMKTLLRRLSASITGSESEGSQRAIKGKLRFSITVHQSCSDGKYTVAEYEDMLIFTCVGLTPLTYLMEAIVSYSEGRWWAEKVRNMLYHILLFLFGSYPSGTYTLPRGPTYCLALVQSCSAVKCRITLDVLGIHSTSSASNDSKTPNMFWKSSFLVCCGTSTSRSWNSSSSMLSSAWISKSKAEGSCGIF